MEFSIRAARAATLRALFRFGNFESTFLPTSFGDMHYLDSAPGSDARPAVLIHGIGSSGRSMLAVAALVRMHRRVVIPDLFHFEGLSEAAALDTLSTGQHVDALAEFLRALACGPVDLVGHSMGGGLSIYLVLRYPELVSTLALMNPGGFTFGYSELEADILGMSQETAAKLYDAAFARTRLTQTRAARLVGRRLVYDALSTAAVRSYMGTIRDDEWLDGQVAQVMCPTLLLWGTQDRFLRREIAEHIVREVNQAEAYWLEGCSHMLALEAPYSIYRLLLQFWKRHEPRWEATYGVAPRSLPWWLEAVLPPPASTPIMGSNA